MRAVFDPNVIISAALSPRGAPGRLFRHWLEGAYDVVVSPLLLQELRRALSHPKLADRIPPQDAEGLVALLARAATLTQDPDRPPQVSAPDPDDDYLIALAAQSQSILISGDKDLLELAGRIPVYSPAEALDLIENRAQ